jgi:hypothetical protein
MRPYFTDGGSAAHDATDHASDADLLRILDREAPLSPLHDTTAHVSSCAVCADRFDLLRQRRLKLASLLADADRPLPAAPSVGEMLAKGRARRAARRRPLLRAAALLLAVGTLAAAQPGVRRWIGAQWDRITSGAEAGAPAPRDTIVTSAAAPSGNVSGSLLAFDAGAGPLAIHYDIRPVAGTLTVLSDTGALVRAERTSGANLELLVMRRMLRVRNAEGGVASYVVHVPRAIRRVQLRFGKSASAADTTLDLSSQTRHVLTFD